MAEGSSGNDSFEVVKGFLDGLNGRKPDLREVQDIAPALHDIYQRLMRVRSYAPGVDVSARMWGLMEMIGIRAVPARGSSIRKAASFL
jgi:hypothetical protein